MVVVGAKVFLVDHFSVPTSMKLLKDGCITCNYFKVHNQFLIKDEDSTTLFIIIYLHYKYVIKINFLINGHVHNYTKALQLSFQYHSKQCYVKVGYA